MEENVIESNQAEPQEATEVVEPAANAEDQSVQDVWAEDFDMNDDNNTAEQPQKEVADTEPSEEPAVELEYKTEGLGDLDAPLVVKRKGKLYDLTDMDQIRNLVEKGLDSTIKNQELADMRRELEKERNPDITDKELNTLDTNAEIETIAEKIASSDYADAFKGIVSVLPSNTVDQLRSDPRMLEGLRVDTESGLAAKIMPLAEKYMAIEGLDFMEAYIKGGNEINKSAQSRSQSIDKLTAVPKTHNNVEVKQKDIWEMTDSEYNALMSSERR